MDVRATRDRGGPQAQLPLAPTGAVASPADPGRAGSGGSGPSFDIQEIPFSFFGSWLALSPVVANRTHAKDLHLVSHRAGLHPVLRLVTVGAGGSPVQATVSATAHLLSWQHGSGGIDVVYHSADTIRMRGRGLGLQLLAADPELTPFSGAYFFLDPVDGSYTFTLYETGRRYRITLLAGKPPEVFGAHALGVSERGIGVSGSEEWELALEECTSARPPYRSTLAFDHVVDAAGSAFAEFLEAVAPWRGTHTPAAELAAYVIWSAGVEPGGFVTRPAILMSKHWMNKVWSWDHCFNALALARGKPELAWDQFQLMFDQQDEAGALPDSITHSEILYNFVKPPIHGWAFRRLRQELPELNRERLIATYRGLERWTRFWLAHRRVPGRPLAHYQHGNDSGWDNASSFDGRGVVESADLAAYLVLQLGELAELADLLGFTAAAVEWRDAAGSMRGALLSQLWTGREFVTAAADSSSTWAGTSLLTVMPIVLGEELPDAVRQALADRIREHLTPYGLATELPGSPSYQEDGYWRGPIWAPVTVLIEDGLRRAGFSELADDVATRFLALCEKSGFSENFDAISGDGLRDSAYTWTAASYLILAAAAERRRVECSATAP